MKRGGGERKRGMRTKKGKRRKRSTRKKNSKRRMRKNSKRRTKRKKSKRRRENQSPQLSTSHHQPPPPPPPIPSTDSVAVSSIISTLPHPPKSKAQSLGLASPIVSFYSFVNPLNLPESRIESWAWGGLLSWISLTIWRIRGCAVGVLLTV